MAVFLSHSLLGGKTPPWRVEFEESSRESRNNPQWDSAEGANARPGGHPGTQEPGQVGVGTRWGRGYLLNLNSALASWPGLRVHMSSPRRRGRGRFRKNAASVAFTPTPWDMDTNTQGACCFVGVIGFYWAGFSFSFFAVMRY